jgi:Tol biopolymer transport system component
MAASGFQRIQPLPQGNLAFLKDRQKMVVINRSSGATVRELPNIDLSNTVGDLGALFSPDGNRLAYVEVNKQLWLANADGSAAMKLANRADGIWNVKWSPDGKYLAYGNNGIVWIVSRDGSGIHKLVGVEQMPIASYDPRVTTIGIADWSPDSRVLFLVYSPGMRTVASTFVIDLNGGAPQLLLANYGLYGLSSNGDRATFALQIADDGTTHLIMASLTH